jgi:hypothetical protein
MAHIEYMMEKEKLRKHIFKIKNDLSLTLSTLELELLDELVNSIYQLAKYETQEITMSKEELINITCKKCILKHTEHCNPKEMALYDETTCKNFRV